MQTCLPSIPGYEVLRPLGKGGMGQVFLARCGRTGREVAVKVLRDVGRDQQQRQARFGREGEILSALSHPHIVPVLATGSAGGVDYLVMEYVPGGNLRAELEPGQPLPVARARALLGEIAGALAYLDEQEIVHRDLKPENILLAGGSARVSDFGLSSRVTEIGLVTSTGQVLGTFEYMAPEQRARLPVDERADQYALAVIAYEMLTGKRPVGRFKPPSEHNPRLNPRVDAVLERALQEDPDDRYPDTASFSRDLEEALAAPPPRRVRKRLAVLGTLVLLLSVMGGLAVAQQLWLRPTEGRPGRIDYYLRLAEKHSRAHRRELAIDCYTEAIRLAPDDPSLRVRRADSYLLNGQYEKALEDLGKALTLDPRSADAFAGRGAVYLQLQDADKALADLDRAVALNPRLALAYAHRGRAHWFKKNKERALADFTRAVELDADCGLAYYYRGILRQGKKDYAGARADLENSVRCTPDNPFAHSSLAYLLAACPDRAVRDGGQAVVHARKACEFTEWKDAIHIRRLAMAHAEKGETSAAISFCEQALRLPTVTSKEKRLLGQLLARYRKRLQATEGEARP
jgi:tetratricopeptide (TPR) repeat protein